MMNKQKQRAFIMGKLVYLRTPDIQADVYGGDWNEWFSDMEITKYLVHGIRPVSKDDQAKLVQSELENPKTLLFAIIEKASQKHIGVVSLKSIDLLNKTAEIAIVMGFDNIPGAALEAMALMTAHAFERMNLNKLYAGQHEGLWKWVNTLELIGYRIEGYRRQGGVRGLPYDIVLTGITSDDYFNLKKKRGGSVLTENIHQLYQNKRRENMLPNIKAFFDNLYL